MARSFSKERLKVLSYWNLNDEWEKLKEYIDYNLKYYHIGI